MIRIFFFSLLETAVGVLRHTLGHRLIRSMNVLMNLEKTSDENQVNSFKKKKMCIKFLDNTYGIRYSLNTNTILEFSPHN